MTAPPLAGAASQSRRVRSLLVLARADIALCGLPCADAFLVGTPDFESRWRELVGWLRTVGEALIHAASVAHFHAEASGLRPALLSPLVRKVARVARALDGPARPGPAAALAQLAHDALAEVSAGASVAFSVMKAAGTHAALAAVLGATVEAALALRQLLRAQTRQLACHAVAQSSTWLIA